MGLAIKCDNCGEVVTNRGEVNVILRNHGGALDRLPLWCNKCQPMRVMD